MKVMVLPKRRRRASGVFKIQRSFSQPTAPAVHLQPLENSLRGSWTSHDKAACAGLGGDYRAADDAVTQSQLDASKHVRVPTYHWHYAT